MAKPVAERLANDFVHYNAQLPNNIPVQPFPTSTPLREGVWITLDNRNFRIALAPGVLIVGDGLRLDRRARTVFFFPCRDASLLRVVSEGNNGRIAVMAG